LIFEKRNACNEIKKGIPTGLHQYESLKFLTCVCNFYDPQIHTLIDLAQQYKQIGPNSNISKYSSTEISSKMMNFIKFINSFIAEKELEESKKQQLKLKQKR
jgi:hypothetical protein